MTCKNGATCSNVEGVAQCSCANGWLGETCDLKEVIFGQEDIQSYGSAFPQSSAAIITDIPAKCNGRVFRWNFFREIEQTEVAYFLILTPIRFRPFQKRAAPDRHLYANRYQVRHQFRVDPGPAGYTSLDIDEPVAIELFDVFAVILTQGSHFISQETCSESNIREGCSQIAKFKNVENARPLWIKREVKKEYKEDYNSTFAKIALQAVIGCNVTSNFDPCFMACYNGATCRNIGWEAQCTCADGFRGETCGQIDPCYMACKNGATCSDDGGEVQCSCADGWLGQTCEESDGRFDNDPCFMTCKNGGTCTDNEGVAQCSCAEGWTGDSCDIKEVTFGPNDIKSYGSVPSHDGAVVITDIPVTCEEGKLLRWNFFREVEQTKIAYFLILKPVQFSRRSKKATKYEVRHLFEVESGQKGYDTLVIDEPVAVEQFDVFGVILTGDSHFISQETCSESDITEGCSQIAMFTRPKTALGRWLKNPEKIVMRKDLKDTFAKIALQAVIGCLE